MKNKKEISQEEVSLYAELFKIVAEEEKEQEEKEN
jgi:hypothetical protein